MWKQSKAQNALFLDHNVTALHFYYLLCELEATTIPHFLLKESASLRICSGSDAISHMETFIYATKYTLYLKKL